jgi:hypothetical protein
MNHEADTSHPEMTPRHERRTPPPHYRTCRPAAGSLHRRHRRHDAGLDGYENAKTLEATDQNLRTAARSLRLLLAPDFHDRAVDADSIGFEEELANRNAFNAFAKANELIYVYTLVMKDGALFFSAPTVTEDEARERKVWYFYPYEEAPPEFARAMRNGTDVSVSYSDEWGDFRTACVFETSPGGNPYLGCADMEIRKLARINATHAMFGTGAALLFLSFLIPATRIIRRFYRMHIDELNASHRKRRSTWTCSTRSSNGCPWASWSSSPTTGSAWSTRPSPNSRATPWTTSPPATAGSARPSPTSGCERTCSASGPGASRASKAPPPRPP